jgi:D-alanyl-D-alanine carboxypeptidase/D-alanyl-D-alanine-endopeptidase (penicillin-binding protein 4)
VTRRAGCALAVLLFAAACGAPRSTLTRLEPFAVPDVPPTLESDLDAIFDDATLARALVGVHVESLDGGVRYSRNAEKLVVPASNIKIFTLAAAASRLGWEFRHETTLDAAGTIADGTLTGDLIVTGGGDPSIGTLDGRPAVLFTRWADALRDRGIRRVEGRLVGDDNVFDDEGRGAGWAWDYLTAGYAAPAGGLSYNENVAVVQATPGRAEGDPVQVSITAGHPFRLVNQLLTGPPGSASAMTLRQDDTRTVLTLTGRLPAGGAMAIQTSTVANPTRYFVGALGEALAARGIVVTGGVWDVDDLAETPPPSGRTRIARHESLPLSALASRLIKSSQNFYGEMLLQTLGAAAGGEGTAEAGLRIVRDTVVGWGVPADAVVLYDGSGLSRYNYATAAAIVRVLRRVWDDERLRAPFLALLPVGGQDGTLSARMSGEPLAGHVQAKTGTIANMRALSGFLEAQSGERLVFSAIVNHFTAPAAEIDAIVERALARLVRE